MNTIQQGIETLKEGGLIIYPTDTNWSIGCDATNKAAVDKLIQLKKRETGKGFTVLVDSVNRLERIVPEFPEVCYDLIDLTDKPLTIIYEDPIGLAENVLSNESTVGIRVTTNPICRKLIQGLRKPIVSSSANFSDSPTPTCFKEIDLELIKQVDFCVKEQLDEVKKQPASILKISKNNRVEIIRK